MTKKAVSDVLAASALTLCGGSVASMLTDHQSLGLILIGAGVVCAIATTVVDRSRDRATEPAAALSDTDVEDTDRGHVQHADGRSR